MKTRSWTKPEILFLAVLIAIHVGMAVMSSSQTNDDAFISFRYARNLVEGNGLVFNVGERVEGYTNFLWIMILWLFMPFFDPVVISKILGVCCNVLLIASLGSFSRRYSGWLMWLAPLYVALDPAVLRWGTRGLETSLFGLLLWLAVYVAVSSRYHGSIAGVIAALATMARPDGFVVAVIVSVARLAGMVGFGYYRSDAERDVEQVSDAGVSWYSYLVRYWLGCGAVLVPYLIWKLVYYGNVLPNTFYAKTSGGVFKLWRGLAYLTSGWSWPELWIGGAVIWAAVSRKRSSLATRTVSYLALVYVVYVVWVGGDSLGPDRFLAPIVPLLIVSGCLVLSHWTGAEGSSVKKVICGMILGVVLVGNMVQLPELIGSEKVYSAEKEAAHPRARLGRCLAEHAGTGDSVATSLIGRMPYYSRLTTLDMFGLIDPHIARKESPAAGSGAAGHEKTDIDYILSRKPDWIIANELVVAPPRERPWLSGLRRRISGDPPSSEMRLLTPPFDGYARVEVRCSDYRGRLWKRVDSSERNPDRLKAAK